MKKVDKQLDQLTNYNDLVNYAYSLVNIANKNYLKGETTAYPVLLLNNYLWA